MSEYMVSNHTQTLAVNLEDGSWRVLDLPLQALRFEWDTGLTMTSFDDKVLLLEDVGALDDDGAPVPYEIETPSFRTDVAQIGLPSRLYIEANTRGQFLQVLLVIDDEDVLQLEPLLMTTKRQTVEFPVSVTGHHRTFAVRLLGDLTERVDIYGIEMDIDVVDIERHKG